MSRRLFLTVVLIMGFFYTDTFGQDLNLDWMRYENPINQGSYIQNVDMVVNEAVWTIGNYSGQVILDTNFELNCPSLEDHMFLIKRDLNGDLIWGKSITSNDGLNYGSVRVSSLSIDTNGNIYTCGIFYGNIVFNPFGQQLQLTAYQNGPSSFVSKIDSIGNVIWAKVLSNGHYSESLKICSTEEGRIALTGTFQDTVSFMVGNGTVDFESLGQNNAFILSMDAQGDIIWTKQIGSQGDINVRSILYDSLNGHHIIAGSYSMNVDFNLGYSNGQHSAINGQDCWVSVFNWNGEFMWAQVARNNGEAVMNQIVLDSAGNIYGVGHFENVIGYSSTPTYYLNAGNTLYNGFVVKYNQEGNLVWAKNIGKFGSTEKASKIAINENRLVIIGDFSQSFDIDHGSSVFQVTPNQQSDFLMLLDFQGDFIHAEVIGDSYLANNKSVWINSNDDIFLCGSSINNLDYDPGVQEFILPTIRSFCLKLKRCQNVEYVDSIFSCVPIIWIDGLTYNTNNTTASFVLVSSQGCDSIVYLNLEISSVNTNLIVSDSSILSLASGVEYQWYTCGDDLQIIPGANDSTYTFSSEGQFLVELISESCSWYSECISVGMVNQDEKNLNLLKLSPNPANSGVYLYHKNGDNFSIVIYNQFGHIVSEFKNLNHGDYVDIQNLENGLYYFHYTNKINSGYQKLLKK